MSEDWRRGIIDYYFQGKAKQCGWTFIEVKALVDEYVKRAEALGRDPRAMSAVLDRLDWSGRGVGGERYEVVKTDLSDLMGRTSEEMADYAYVEVDRLAGDLGLAVVSQDELAKVHELKAVEDKLGEERSKKRIALEELNRVKSQLEEERNGKLREREREVLAFENLFSLDLAKKTNILVSGSNASGKTNLAVGIASVLNGLGYRVVVFDSSGTWKKTSNLPHVMVYSFTSIVNQGRKVLNLNSLRYIPLSGSGIYDLSLLKLSDTRRLVEDETNKLWLERAQNHDREFKPMWLIFEESEIYLKNIRGSLSENVYRVLHVGRNLGIRAILVTTDLALLDASVIRLCQLRFHGTLGIEENGKHKFAAYYGKEMVEKATRLKTGQFLSFSGLTLVQVEVPLFKFERPVETLVQVRPVQPVKAVVKVEEKKRFKWF